MNSQLEKATSHVTGVFYSLAIAIAVVGAISLIAAKTIGGKTKRQQKHTAELVFALGMLAFALLFLPAILRSGA